MANVNTTLHDAQQLLFQHIGSDTILCGHSLENDLHALRIVHELIIDTSVLYPRGDGMSAVVKHSLRYLANKHLGRDIQNEVSHLPTEDASAALALATLRLRAANQAHNNADDGAASSTTAANAGLMPHTELLFATLSRGTAPVTMIDRHSTATRYTTATQANAVGCVDDAAVVQALRSTLTGASRFVWARLRAVRNVYEQRSVSIMEQVKLDAAAAASGACVASAAPSSSSSDDPLLAAIARLDASAQQANEQGFPGSYAAARYAQDTRALAQALATLDAAVAQAYKVRSNTSSPRSSCVSLPTLLCVLL